jgi:hypothetical protein
MKHLPLSKLLRSMAWPALAMTALTSQQAWAVYSCNVTATSTGVIYVTPASQDSQGVATLTCTRDSGDATTLTYRLKADNGLHVTGTQRRVRLGTTGNYLRYSLTRAAACGNASNWYAPATGTTNVVTGTLNFGAALSQSVNVSYCLRTRVGGGGNPAAPTAGVYDDTISIFGQFPNNNAGALTPAAPITYSVGVNNQCVLNSFPTRMVFNYTSFSPAPQVATQSFNLRCSNNLPWTATVSPAAATVLGLNYTVAVSPNVTTLGTGVNQPVTLTGTMPAGQAGTCNTGVCTGTQPHTVTITY